MHIEEISIRNFRNIENENIFPYKGINLIIGKNAQGKTNFLESIYVVSNLKSFRGKKISETINNNFLNSILKVKVNKNRVSNLIYLEIEKNLKNLLLNNKKPTKISESVGLLDTVLFYPDDIIVVKGSPVLRRSLLDRAIFQTDNNYLSLFQEYLRCLKQRNAALKGKEEISDLWDNQFVELATRVTFYRLNYVERINRILDETFDNIYQCGEKVQIKYPASEEDPQTFKKNFSARLAAGRKKELLYGLTLVGPHREDPQFLLNGQSLSLYGSQGQQRSFMLAFKTAQVIDFKEQRGIRPVLLLDDMTSELDDDRRDSFFESLLDQAGQVFVTSTDVNLLKHRRFSDARFLKVENGKIAEYN